MSLSTEKDVPVPVVVFSFGLGGFRSLLSWSYMEFTPLSSNNKYYLTPFPFQWLCGTHKPRSWAEWQPWAKPTSIFYYPAPPHNQFGVGHITQSRPTTARRTHFMELAGKKRNLLYSFRPVILAWNKQNETTEWNGSNLVSIYYKYASSTTQKFWNRQNLVSTSSFSFSSAFIYKENLSKKFGTSQITFLMSP